jgi:hypothetical protein
LQHELRDHTVEAGTLVAKPILACGELPEVSGGLGDNVVVKLENNPPSLLAADGDIKLGVRIREN